MQHLKETENKPYNTAEDEIDLMSIFRFLDRQLQKIRKGLKFLLNAVFSNILPLLLIVSAGVGGGYALYNSNKPYYTSSMTLMLANIRNEFIEEQLIKLSEMIQENNFEAVADRLDISSEAAKQIKEMKFSNLDEDRIEEDSILTGSPFKIELSLYDKELFSSMEPALTNYLENNRYFAKQKRIKQKQVEDMIFKLRGEISSIDSMKNNVGTPRGPVNGFVYGQPLDPTNLYKESISMFKEQVQLEASLERLDNVEVVSGFVPKLRPTGPSLRKHLTIGGFIGLLIGVIVVLGLESKKQGRRRV
jgi:uncharacterized protein involved in exopolysaccharide biosynthesis